jgi:hypothetical protein
MRRLIDYLVWRLRAGRRGPLAYRMLAGALVPDERARRGS